MIDTWTWPTHLEVSLRASTPKEEELNLKETDL